MKSAYLIFTLLLVVSCTQIPTPNDNSVINKEASIGELFKLHMGESAKVSETNMEITLQNASNDFCPEDVLCVTGGNFYAEVTIKDLETGETREKTFSAFTDAGFDYTLFNGLVISPVEWKPMKRLVGVLIEESSYEITFVVKHGIDFNQQFIMEVDDIVPMGDGNLILSLDDIVVRNNKNAEPEEPQSEVSLHFSMSDDFKNHSDQVEYVPYVPSNLNVLPVELGDYQIFLKELIGKQPYYHSFNIYDAEVVDPSQYRARILVVKK